KTLQRHSRFAELLFLYRIRVRRKTQVMRGVCADVESPPRSKLQHLRRHHRSGAWRCCRANLLSEREHDLAAIADRQAAGPGVNRTKGSTPIRERLDGHLLKIVERQVKAPR